MYLDNCFPVFRYSFNSLEMYSIFYGHLPELHRLRCHGPISLDIVIPFCYANDSQHEFFQNSTYRLNAERLQIDGTNKQICWVTLNKYNYTFPFQLFPADAVLNKEVYSDKNLVCAPVIKVSGQTTPFLKDVDVELTYSNNDVANIEEDFLPVGSRIQYTTEYGLLLRSQETKSTSKCQKLNENSDVYIERLRKDRLKFLFSLKHFCK